MKIDREQLQDVAIQADLFDDDVRFDYSGRGMYGRTCFGIVGSLRDLMAFAGAAISELDDAETWLPSVQTDSMGRGSIYYWPNLQVATEETCNCGQWPLSEYGSECPSCHTVPAR